MKLALSFSQMASLNLLVLRPAFQAATAEANVEAAGVVVDHFRFSCALLIVFQPLLAKNAWNVSQLAKTKDRIQLLTGLRPRLEACPRLSTDPATAS